MKRYLLIVLLSMTGITFGDEMLDKNDDKKVILNNKLFNAVQDGDLKGVEDFLEKGADPSFKARVCIHDHCYDVSILAIAHPKVVETLIAAGADIRVDGSMMFKERLIATTEPCMKRNLWYNTEKCEAQKKALKLFLQSKSFQNGLSSEEQQKEIKAAFNSLRYLYFDKEEKEETLHKIVSEICDEQVVQAAYTDTRSWFEWLEIIQKGLF